MSSLTILGIESSCDETAAAVVARDGHSRPDGPGRILSNAVFGQGELHGRFGGVVPEIAARAHAERADLVVERALAEAGTAFSELDAIAVTAGPGLIGGVLVGVMTARALAAATGLALIGINHLEGHALTPRLTDGVACPYLLLLVSGGHCQFLAVEGLGRYRRLGGTIDDAPGEAFDKVARALGLGFPGGPEIERAAAQGDPVRFTLPRPLIERDDCDLSFSGLKTAVVRARDRLVAAQGGLWRRDIADLSAAFEAAVAEVLAAKTRRAMRRFAATLGAQDAQRGEHEERTLAVAGGVAANRVLRTALAEAATAEGFRLVAPPMALCTDNGAMIAWAGLERHAAALAAGLPHPPVIARPRWPLDLAAAPMLGAGKRGAKA
jgi:N6-L-threonylcarbamoyladenine synthase